MLLVKSTFDSIWWELYEEGDTFWRKCGDRVFLFSISLDVSSKEEKQLNLEKIVGINVSGSSHMIGAFH